MPKKHKHLPFYGKDNEVKYDHNEIPEDVLEALKVCVKIEFIIQETDEYTKIKYDEYFDNTLDKARSISKTINRNNAVTIGQKTALNNLLENVTNLVLSNDD